MFGLTSGSFSLERVIAAILRGEPVGWPRDAGQPEEARFLQTAARHGVGPLLAHHLHCSGVLRDWPEPVSKWLRQAAREEVLADQVRRPELLHLLSTMATVNVRPLIMKGAAVADLYYPSPFLRPRCDVDLLIRKKDVARVIALMGDCGYRRASLIPGDLVMPQCPFFKADRSGFPHTYDLHWQIANPQPFAGVLLFDELAGRSIELPALGEHARTLAHIDALLLACIHRVAHHADSPRLLWLYDIHLMASCMDRQTFQGFAALAAEKQVAAVCAGGLALAQTWFHTELPMDLMEALRACASTEPSARYIGGRMRPLDVLLSDLRLLRGWRSRWQLIREHLFPPARYMLERYAVSNPLLLPALYTHRLVRGAAKWFGGMLFRNVPSE
jgi:putative nucleotidyltransferase-like protein